MAYNKYVIEGENEELTEEEKKKLEEKKAKKKKFIKRALIGAGVATAAGTAALYKIGTTPTDEYRKRMNNEINKLYDRYDRDSKKIANEMMPLINKNSNLSDDEKDFKKIDKIQEEFKKLNETYKKDLDEIEKRKGKIKK